jgi:hypothetical protein
MAVICDVAPCSLQLKHRVMLEAVVFSETSVNTLQITPYVVVEWLTHLLRVGGGVSRSITGPETGFSDSGSSLFSSVPTGECGHSVSN